MAVAENLEPRSLLFCRRTSDTGDGGGDGIPKGAQLCFCRCIRSVVRIWGRCGASIAGVPVIALAKAQHDDDPRVFSSSSSSLSSFSRSFCGRPGYNAAMALSANAVVRPRLPSLRPDEPYLYTQLGSHPPSSCCSGRMEGGSPVGCTSTARDRKSTRLNSSHTVISYAVF